MYQEIILDHYRNPHHKGLREPYDAQVHHVNPTCGCEVTLRVALKGSVDLNDGGDGEQPVLADVSYEALGSSIHLASTSIMTDLIIGKTVGEAMAISDAFLNLMHSHGNTEPDEDVLEDAVALAGVSRYPARVKCALLGWMAWKDATQLALSLRGDAAPTASRVAAALGFVSGPEAELFNHHQVILDHYREPLHVGLRDPFDAQVHHANRDGNDEVTMRVTLNDADGGPVLADVSYQALGCAINRASVSVMADMVIGKTVGEATAISTAFLNLMQSRGNIRCDVDMLGDAVAFADVSMYPSRIKCVTLGWMAWKDVMTLAFGQLD